MLSCGDPTATVEPLPSKVSDMSTGDAAAQTAGGRTHLPESTGTDGRSTVNVRARPSDSPAAAEPDLAPSQTRDPTSTVPSANPVRALVLEALDELGVEPTYDPPDPFGANITVEHDHGVLQVLATEEQRFRGDPIINSTDSIGGVDVAIVEYDSGIIRWAFSCGGVRFEVGGNPLPVDATIESFTGELIAAIDTCPSLLPTSR
ncbi:MAG: hypothetical protein CL424_13700 [Acidimicrobiaceae bacterium]|nr:hypothetical protein [Acidimicrobiaceae bacterium]